MGMTWKLGRLAMPTAPVPNAVATDPRVAECRRMVSRKALVSAGITVVDASLPPPPPQPGGAVPAQPAPPPPQVDAVLDMGERYARQQRGARQARRR